MVYIFLSLYISFKLCFLQNSEFLFVNDILKSIMDFLILFCVFLLFQLVLVLIEFIGNLVLYIFWFCNLYFIEFFHKYMVLDSYAAAW